MEPATHEVIERLAALQGRTRGAIISELLDSIAPSLTRTVSLLEAAMDAPNDIKRGLKAVVESIHSELLEVSGEATNQLDLLIEQFGSEAGGDALNPHVVTRGSGTPPIAEQAALKRPRKRSKPGGPAHG